MMHTPSSGMSSATISYLNNHSPKQQCYQCTPPLCLEEKANHHEAQTESRSVDLGRRRLADWVYIASAGAVLLVLRGEHLFAPEPSNLLAR
jgi:hypothetical protein